MNSHDEIQKCLSAYCSGDLEATERARIEAHMTVCPSCRADLCDMKLTLQLIRTTPHVEAPPWMTSRIMAHLREEKAAKRGWLQRFWFPQHTAFPVKILALLVVCVSGYYLSHTVETELKKTAQQQLQELPTQQAPAAPQLPAQAHEKQEKQEQPAVVIPQTTAPPVATPQQSPRQENIPVQTSPQLPAASAPGSYAPSPPSYKDTYGAKSEMLKAAPMAESFNRAQESTPEKKTKSGRTLERGSDAMAPAVADRATGAAAGLTMPQAIVRLSVEDPSSAAAMIRETIIRSGGQITEDRGISERRLVIHIPAARQNELIERLQRLGRIVERPVSPTAGNQRIDMTIQW
jgi:anti-sigma factor RsiW